MWRRRSVLAMDDEDDDAVGDDWTLSSAQLRAVRAVIVACSVLSMAGCAFILFHYWRSARRRRQAARRGDGSCGAAASIVPKMIAVLSVVNFLFSLPKLLGIPSTHDMALCRTQGFVLHFFGLTSVFWNACIAHCLYCKIVRGDSEALLHLRLKIYAITSVSPAATISWVLLGAGRFGAADFYCWVPDRTWQFWCFYLFVLLAIVYVGVVLLATHAHILRFGSGHRSLDALESSARIVLALRFYIGAFIVLWLPAVAFRLLHAYLERATFTIAVIMQLALCLQGFATAAIYGGALTKLRQVLVGMSCCPCGPKGKAAASETKRATSPYFPTADMSADVDDDEFEGLSGRGQDQSARHPVSIFVSTFNLGEAKLSAADLEKWIPLGYDIYVIGLQECLYLSETRALLQRHLDTAGSAGNAGGSRFYAFNREIGSTNTSLGYHGHIAISVFIQAEDVESGAFYMPPVVRQQVNCGKSLVLGRASNKGAVGVAFRYYDSSFAFVSCHLSSDSKGKSKVRRRNRDLVDMLKGLHLNLEDVGVEFPYLHHHSFVLGDLNYRLRDRDGSVDSVFDLLTSIRAGEIAESHRRQHPRADAPAKKARWSWSSATSSMKLKLKKKTKMADAGELGSRMLSQPLHSAASSVESDGGGTPAPMGLAHGDSSFSASSALVDDDYRVWDDLLAHDELRNLMRDERVLFEFEEAPIAFPPTFRRVRGTTGLARDPTRPWTREELEQVYTTVLPSHGSQRGGVAYDVSGGSSGSGSSGAPDAALVRVPSYTDRILFRSLPDMRDRLHCSLYTSCEAVSCSDHKPVLGIFHALVDRTRLPAESEAALRKIERMEHLAGVRECALRVSFTDLTWNDAAPATSVAGDERPLLFFDRRASQAIVSVVFPLPPEDIFSAQRRLHELADAVSGGVFLGGDSGGSVRGGSNSVSSTASGSSTTSSLDGSQRRQPRRQSSMGSAVTSNTVHARWPRFEREGVAHTTLARPGKSGMHVAIKVHTAAGQRVFGQGVICVPLPAREANSSSVRRDFCIELADGGRRTATLRGSVSLRVSRLASAALGDDGGAEDPGLSIVDELHVLGDDDGANAAPSSSPYVMA